jgi:hypothetical protein
MSTHGTPSKWDPEAEQDEYASGADEYGSPSADGADAPPYGRPEAEPLAAGEPAAMETAAPASETGRPGLPADTESPAVADQDATAEDSGDDELSGAMVEDVIVVESIKTGDQSSADYGAAGSDVNGSHSGDSDIGEAVSASPAGSGAAYGADAGTGGSAAEWSEIKALFVDDPGASVQRASALVEVAVDGFMASLRQRQNALGSWQEGDAAGTEDLRVALRGYRGLFDELERMSDQFSTRSAGQSPEEAGTTAAVTGI